MACILITGVSGYIGQKLVAQLAQSQHQLFGTDKRQPTRIPEGVTFCAFDIRDRRLIELIKTLQVEIIIHLAYLIPPYPFKPRVNYDINVNGTRNILEASKNASVQHIIYTSSSIVYGGSKEGKVFSEIDSVNAIDGFEYASHKIESENDVLKFQKEFPEKKITMFRPGPIMGPTTENCLTMAYQQKKMIVLKGTNSRIQFVHEDDVVGAICLAVEKSVGGVFNLGADETLGIADLFQQCGVQIQYAASFWFNLWYTAMKWLRISPFSEKFLHGVCDTSLVVDNSKTKSTLGYQFQYTSKQAFNAYVKHRQLTKTIAV